MMKDLKGKMKNKRSEKVKENFVMKEKEINDNFGIK